MSNKPEAVFRKADDCQIEQWNDEQRGHVKWQQLIDGDFTSTTGLTIGIAEVPVGAKAPVRGHCHDAEEVYFFLNGTGRVHIDGKATDVQSGTVVWIPQGAEHFCDNIGNEPLKLLYVFARDKLSDVHYCFPGAN